MHLSLIYFIVSNYTLRRKNYLLDGLVYTIVHKNNNNVDKIRFEVCALDW